MLRYKDVEIVLARLNGITTEALSTFKGRIIHLQRVGLSPSTPGRGKKIEYTIYDLLLWAYCFELEQFGLDPTLIAKIAKATVSILVEAFEKVDKVNVDVLLVLYPNILTSELNNRAHAGLNILQDAPMGISIFSEEEQNVAAIFDRMKPMGEVGGQLAAKSGWPRQFERRIALLNVTKLKRQLEEALSQVPGLPPYVLKDIVFERMAGP